MHGASPSSPSSQESRPQYRPKVDKDAIGTAPLQAPARAGLRHGVPRAGGRARARRCIPPAKPQRSRHLPPQAASRQLVRCVTRGTGVPLRRWGRGWGSIATRQCWQNRPEVEAYRHRLPQPHADKCRHCAWSVSVTLSGSSLHVQQLGRRVRLRGACAVGLC